MPVEVKICGINTPAACAAAVGAGADYIGLIFYPPSPRAVTPEQAGEIAADVPERVVKVGLLVDADDATIRQIVARAPLGLLQLHGAESPRRVAAIRARFGIPVMKAIKVAGQDDVAAAQAYCRVADRLLFDAKPPEDMKGALPGGNALAFDWRLLGGRSWPIPWMLSGGLDAGNVAEAVRTARARAVDVSSGVEDRPGLKNPDKIRTFLAAAKAL
ncbi:MAG: phosphoribosylanthranilate isomerase [Kiloniellaceae bacterium]